MITLLTGKKGSGKTKKLIELANKAANESKGNVVVLEKGSKLTYDIAPSIRLINVDDYGVSGKDSLKGFVCGILAGNYDITDVFVDSTLKVIDESELEAFVTGVAPASKDVNMVLLVSADEADVPAGLTDYIAK
jgi:energy-coupling factor transporter ATP-binding protein EcfA2